MPGYARRGRCGTRSARYQLGHGTRPRIRPYVQLGINGQLLGAEGGTRTLTPLRGADFKSAASAIPPLRRERDRPSARRVEPSFRRRRPGDAPD